MLTRRRARVAVAVHSPSRAPSGRFDAFVDMGNPMKGVNLFPYLRRRAEGRALKAMGPFEALELSRAVCEAVALRRWPHEVFSFKKTYWSLNLCTAYFILFALCQEENLTIN
jgi:hypothetical protein